MKIKYKPKQSTNNSAERIIRDSNPKAIVGTLVGSITTHVSVFILVLVSMFALTFIADSNNVDNVYAASYEYSIKYNDNVVDNMPTDVNDGRAVGGNLSLANETPTRSGYKFLGWCNTLPSTENNADPCSGTTYQPSAGVTIASATNFHLYAMWEKVATLADVTYMQDVFSCTDTPDGTTNTLTDSRDGKTYTVAKINGACWMTQNLAIGPGTHMTTNDTNITPAQYNNTNYYMLPGSGYDLRADGESDGNCYGTGTNTSNASGGGWTNACTHIADDTDVNDTGGRYTKQQLGAWYNYAAATADTIIGTAFNATVDTYNICPKGWTLPASGSGAGQISSVTGYKDAFNPLHGGYYKNGSHDGATTAGYWWSATSRHSNGHYRLRLAYNSSDVLSATLYDLRRIGYYVRCIRVP